MNMALLVFLFWNLFETFFSYFCRMEILERISTRILSSVMKGV